MSADILSVLCLALPAVLMCLAIYCLSYSRSEILKRFQGIFRRWKYRRYLRSPHWIEMRKKILKRAGYKCEKCHRHAPLDVHHLTYARRGHEDMGDLQALCRPCHQKAHGRKATGKRTTHGLRLGRLHL